MTVLVDAIQGTNVHTLAPGRVMVPSPLGRVLPGHRAVVEFSPDGVCYFPVVGITCDTVGGEPTEWKVNIPDVREALLAMSRVFGVFVPPAERLAQSPITIFYLSAQGLTNTIVAPSFFARAVVAPNSVGFLTTIEVPYEEKGKIGWTGIRKPFHHIETIQTPDDLAAFLAQHSGLWIGSFQKTIIPHFCQWVYAPRAN